MQLEKNEMFRCYSSASLSCVTDIQVSYNKSDADEFTLRFVGATVPEPYEDWTYEEDVHFYFDRYQIKGDDLVSHFKIVIKRCLDYLLEALHETKITMYAERIAEYVNLILHPIDCTDMRIWRGYSCGYAMTAEILFQTINHQQQFKYHITSGQCSDSDGTFIMPSDETVKELSKNFILSREGEHIYNSYLQLKKLIDN